MMQMNRCMAIALTVILCMTGMARAGITTWSFERVEPANKAGWRVRLEMDLIGNPHAVYYSQPLQGHRYISRNSTGWQLIKEFPGSSGLSLVFDEMNRPHFAYTGAGGVKTASMVAEDTWTYHDVASLTVGAWYYTGIFLDQNTPTPSFAYIESVSRTLNYTTWNGAGWDSEIIAYDDKFRFANSIARHAVDQNGNIHFAFTGTDGALRHYYRAGGTWESKNLANGALMNMEFDPSGNLRMIYETGGPYTSTLHQVVYDGDSWTNTGSIANVRSYSVKDVAYDAKDRQYILLYSTWPDPDKLSLLFNDGDTVLKETIAMPSSLTINGPEAASIAIGENGTIHVMYTTDAQELIYAVGAPIPEPMSVILLCAGGISMLRRKCIDTVNQ